MTTLAGMPSWLSKWLRMDMMSWLWTREASVLVRDPEDSFYQVKAPEMTYLNSLTRSMISLADLTCRSSRWDTLWEAVCSFWLRQRLLSSTQAWLWSHHSLDCKKNISNTWTHSSLTLESLAGSILRSISQTKKRFHLGCNTGGTTLTIRVA